jgi:hypothetical protein
VRGHEAQRRDMAAADVEEKDGYIELCTLELDQLRAGRPRVREDHSVGWQQGSSAAGDHPSSTADAERPVCCDGVATAPLTHA